jgi:hypothetical protein
VKCQPVARVAGVMILCVLAIGIGLLLLLHTRFLP